MEKNFLCSPESTILFFACSYFAGFDSWLPFIRSVARAILGHRGEDGVKQDKHFLIDFLSASAEWTDVLPRPENGALPSGDAHQ